MEYARNTVEQYKSITDKVFELFLKKQKDYGLSWRILRKQSMTDQIFIKAKRLRTIEEKGSQEISDSIEGEYYGIINYSIMAMINIRHDHKEELTEEEISTYYKEIQKEVFELMQKKNSDYGEAWRDMKISTMSDLILQNLLRLRAIEDKEELLASEGDESKYTDMINYSIFALILLEEKRV